jgi:membrane associated rhomboid family serine protease
MIPIRDNVPAANFPVVMWGLIAANTLIYLMERTLSEDQLNWLFVLFGVVPARFYPALDASAIPSLITTAFLHGSFLHLLANMWTLYLFGDNVEDRMGPGRFIVFYLTCAVVASVTHIVTNPGAVVPAIGASGAISGVTGAYLVMYPRARILVLIPIIFLPFFFELSSLLYIGFWFLMQLLSGTAVLFSGTSAVGGVAFWAHIGGFIAGVVLYRFFLKPDIDHIDANEFPAESVWQRRSDRFLGEY